MRGYMGTELTIIILGIIVVFGFMFLKDRWKK